MEGTQDAGTATGLASCGQSIVRMATLSDVVEDPLGVEA
jgi:hypothetical protein